MMNEDEEYELLPHKLLEDLKYDVESLKKKLSQPDAKAQELILEIESLKDAIHELNTIFQKALEESKAEDPSALLQSVKDKLEGVIGQNETIARGMIAISDKLEDFMHKQLPPAQSFPSRAPVKHTFGAPPSSIGGLGRTAPLLVPEAPTPEPSDFDLPPPPPGGKKKLISGIFR